MFSMRSSILIYLILTNSNIYWYIIVNNSDKNLAFLELIEGGAYITVFDLFWKLFLRSSWILSLEKLFPLNPELRFWIYAPYALRWLLNLSGNFCLILYYYVKPFLTLLKVKEKWINSLSDMNSSPRFRLPSHNPQLLAFLPSRKIWIWPSLAVIIITATK